MSEPISWSKSKGAIQEVGYASTESIKIARVGHWADLIRRLKYACNSIRTDCAECDECVGWCNDCWEQVDA